MLRCEECDASTAEFAPGWSAFWVDGLEDDPEPFLAVYCAECAEREIGDWLDRLLSARPSQRSQ
jgi:hypothetical protein